MSDPIRIGLYICHCGHNIAGVVDPEVLASQARDLPDVTICRTHLYSCSEAGQREIAKDIKDHNLNRLVLAACSPKLHEPTFRRLLAEAGVNPYLLEIVNIREQCTWVHAPHPAAAADKALELIRMGLAKVRLATPLSDRTVPLTRRSLVLGGGPAGLTAALDIAQGGFPVTLVERAPILGGMANRLYKTFPGGQSALSLINPKMAAAVYHPGIQVLTSCRLTQAQGHIGNFAVTLTQSRPLVSDDCDACGRCVEVCPVTVPHETESQLPARTAIYLPSPTAFPARYVVDLDHCSRCGACVAACPRGAIDVAPQDEVEHRLRVGAIVVATGFTPFNPRSGRYEAWVALPGVLTTLTLEQLLHPAGPTGGQLLTAGEAGEPRDFAFILCVGSREEDGNRYCSRVCCPTALKQALELKARLPQARIRIYYRDIRAVKPEWEELYTRAREAGILFIRGNVRDLGPGDNGGLALSGVFESGDQAWQDRVDLVVLAVGMEPGENALLRSVLKLPVGPDGFFLEAHPKLKPLETVVDGIFLAGACQGPKDLAEAITQGEGAAAKTLALFAHESITLDGLVCEVDPELCIGCESCFNQCPFQAIEMTGAKKSKKARIIESACKGCGVCAGACPSGAVLARGFTDEMILAQIDEATAEAPETKILAFCCNWCSYAGADFAGVSRLPYSPAVRIIRTLCAGRLHPKFIRRALDRGAGRVLVSGCHPPGDCHYVAGNLRVQTRVEKLQAKLAEQGLEPGRLRLAWISATEGKAFQQIVQEMAEEIQAKQESGEAAPQKG